METRIRTRLYAGTLAALLAAAGVLCLHSEPPSPDPTAAAATEENPDMPTVQDRVAARAPIPPLDAAAPAKVETATFALG